MIGIAQGSIFCDEPFVVMFGMLAVPGIQRICHCIESFDAKGHSKQFIVELSTQWMSDHLRLRNELDLDTKVEGVSCHGVCFEAVFVSLQCLGRVLYHTGGQKSDKEVYMAASEAQPHRLSFAENPLVFDMSGSARSGHQAPCGTPLD